MSLARQRANRSSLDLNIQLLTAVQRTFFAKKQYRFLDV